MTPAFLRYAIVLIAAAGMSVLSAPVGTFGGQEHECPVPERFYTSEPLLTKTAKALTGGQEIVIAVLGGASTVGLAAGGGPGLAWPARLSSVLAGRFPSARIKVVNLAVARQTAKAAVERLVRDVLLLKPTLVIWETGTMEAVRGIDVDEFRETVQAGINELRAAGAEVVLMNMQFSRETDAMIDFGPYLITMRELAEANDVPLFRRRGIMRHWAESDLLDLRARDDAKRRQLAAKLYDCIGRALADFVTRGVPAAKPAANPGSDR
ncbi:MAG TPA: GDSL-type esterase/lipase family protein [Pseudolabrys sp.]|nr:GDSL-type esterase/lipase family protein [Pseudolabrys sp.]